MSGEKRNLVPTVLSPPLSFSSPGSDGFICKWLKKRRGPGTSHVPSNEPDPNLSSVCNANHWTVKYWHDTESLFSPNSRQSSKFTLNFKNGPMHVKVWMFLGVARTMVSPLLCCGMWIVQSLFNLLYDSTWPPHQETPKLGTKICTGPELTRNTHCMCVTKFHAANTKVSKDRQPSHFFTEQPGFSV